MPGYPDFSREDMRDLLREIRRLASLAGPLEQFLEIRSDGMLSQRLEDIGNDLKQLWAQIETHTALTERLLETLENQEETLLRMDSLDHKVDRLTQLLEQVVRLRQ